MAPRGKPVSPEDSDLLARMFTYNPDTGQIYRSDGRRVGNPLRGTHIRINAILPSGRRTFLAHRLAWFLHYGVWPKNVIDHIDHDPSNNRIDNLRDVTQWENTINRKKSGKWARYHPPTGRWHAAFQLKGVFYSFGYHDTEEKAHQVSKANRNNIIRRLKKSVDR